MSFAQVGSWRQRGPATLRVDQAAGFLGGLPPPRECQDGGHDQPSPWVRVHAFRQLFQTGHVDAEAPLFQVLQVHWITGKGPAAALADGRAWCGWEIMPPSGA